MNEVGIERARQTLGPIVDRARIAGEPTLITRQNKPAALVLGVTAEQAARNFHENWTALFEALRERGYVVSLRELMEARERREGGE